MSPRIKTFLMFDGTAEAAMNFYVSLFDDARITSMTRYGAGEMGAEGSVMKATFEMGGQAFMCIDTPAKHDFTFTPSISIFVDFQEAAEVDAAFAKLSADGRIYMPLGEYPFSRRYGWVGDKFGVAWQLNLADGAAGGD